MPAPTVTFVSRSITMNEPVSLQKVSPQERAARFGQQAVTFWLTGVDRQQAAYQLERRLFDRGYACSVLDEDVLGDQAGFVARHLNQAGIICICSAALKALPRADVVNVILNAESLDIDEVINRLTEAQPVEPDFDI